MDAREAYEARYLLDGRRVQLGDLLAASLLHPGQTLSWELKRSGAVHKATVEADGTLRLADGRTYRTPSRAAAVAARVTAVDGWHAWTIAETGESLDHLRGRLLDREASGDKTPGDTVGSERRRRFELLRDARASAESGTPIQLTVRDLLRWWHAGARGANVTARVEADLANHGLETWPDFRKVALDTAVVLRAMSDPEDAPDIGDSSVQVGTQAHPESQATHTSPTGAAIDDEDTSADTGITVGNLPSALADLVSVASDASFEQAITLMLVNDFSQLAVLNGRQLRGAVTWRSIAQARNADPNARFADAIVEAIAVGYDAPLTKCLQLLEDQDFFFVRDATDKISGIITATDVVKLYGQLATPFLLIGELDRALRRVMASTFSIDQIRQVADPEDLRDLRSHDDLTFGDYQQVLSNPSLWSELRWALDRKTFVSRLDELREFRNDVMHFNPDPAPPAIVSSLQHFISLVRSYCD